MSSSCAAQSRALVTTLPTLTFSIHAVLIHCALFLCAGTFSSTYWFAAYNVFGACVSIMGFYGALKANPALVSAYTVAHTITLFLGTLTLLNIILPLDLKSIVHIIPSFDVDVTRVCSEIDDSFGWDDGWLERCSTSFRVVKLGAAWVGLVLMLAQWWALWSVWKWTRYMNEEQGEFAGDENRDVEKADALRARQENIGFAQDYKSRE